MKLLIIGSASYDRNKEGMRIDCVPWERLAEIQNVKDYDALLFNVLSLQNEKARKDVDWQIFQGLFDFADTTDVLTHQGHIVVLGDPRFSIPHRKEKDSQRPFLYWTGVSFHWDNRPGDTIQYAHYGIDEFGEYRKHFRHWKYSLAQVNPDERALEQKWNLEALRSHAIRPELRIQRVCTSRYQHPLVFRLTHRLVDAYDRDTICNYGPILFLHEIELDQDETLRLVLRDFCDAASDLPEPPWVSSFPAPGQKAIDEKIAQIQTAVTEQTAALEKALQDRARVRTCLKLLYEREFGLEPVVRQVLGELGAKVEEPVEKNKEDGWITVQVRGATHEGVLEIKSTKSDHFGEDGRKQLLDWMDRGRTLRQKNYKGIFIGNSAVAKPLKERPDAFSDSWKKAAALSHICAIKSEELYIVHVLASQKKINLEDFWAQIFSTDGIFDVSPFLPKSQSAPAPTPNKP